MLAKCMGQLNRSETTMETWRRSEDLPPHCMLACKKPANQVPGGAIHMRGPPFAAAGSAERCLHMAGCNGLRQLEREEEEEEKKRLTPCGNTFTSTIHEHTGIQVRI